MTPSGRPRRADRPLRTVGSVLRRVERLQRGALVAMAIMAVFLVAVGAAILAGPRGMANVCSSYDTCGGATPTMWGLGGASLVVVGVLLAVHVVRSVSKGGR